MPESNKKNKWKYAFWILLLINLVVSFFVIYIILDQAITFTYMKEGYRITKEDLEITMSLIPQIDPALSQSDLVWLLRQGNPEAFITSNDNRVGISSLEFHFDQGSLVEVTR